MGLDNFFHARVGSSAFILSGWARIAFAALLLYDRLLLSLDFDWFFLSGMMPLEASAKYLPASSLLWLSPENPTFYWTIHILTIVHAVLLLVGIAPRLQLALIYVYSMGFWMHNQRIWDSEDDMFRFWNLFLLFLPLDRVTVYEWMTPKAERQPRKDETWPIWPFRLWQIEVCAIYMCAGCAKLSNPEWREGNAMLHVVQTVDFYGGIFNPDIIFNRMGPLLIMTYASLVLECACVVTVWVWPTMTVLAMLGLHLGIEVSMNMHCFEWLCVIGWLMFLVQPMKEDFDAVSVEPEISEVVVNVPNEEEDESIVDLNETLESEESTQMTEVSEEMKEVPIKFLDIDITTKEPARTPILRRIGTGILLAACSTIVLETLPLDKLQPLLPSSMHGHIENLVKQKNALVLRLTDPITYSTGLRQTGWYMYSSPPWVVWQYEAVIELHDGTRKIWKSPDWRNLTWYEQKRYQRHMSFYDRLREASQVELDAFTRYLALDYGMENVASVQLLQHMDTPKIWPREIEFGFFDEAKQPRIRYPSQSQIIYNLNICADYDYRCSEWAQKGFCKWPISIEMGDCRYSCGFCDTIVEKLKPNSRVAVRWLDNEMFYRATVREVKQYPSTQVRLEYDFYDMEKYRYEWLDSSTVLQRKLIHLEDENRVPLPAKDNFSQRDVWINRDETGIRAEL